MVCDDITGEWGGMKWIAIASSLSLRIHARSRRRWRRRRQQQQQRQRQQNNIFSFGLFFAFVPPPPPHKIVVYVEYIAQAFFQAHTVFFLSLCRTSSHRGDSYAVRPYFSVLYFCLNFLFACYLRLSTEWPSMHIFHFLDEIFHVFFFRRFIRLSFCSYHARTQFFSIRFLSVTLLPICLFSVVSFYIFFQA